VEINGVNMSTAGLDEAAAELTKQVVKLMVVRIVPFDEVDSTAGHTPGINQRR
jgi:hypothetical protein